MVSPSLLLACLATPGISQAFLSRAGPLSQQSVYRQLTLYSSSSSAFESTCRGVASNPGQRSHDKKRRNLPVGPAGVGTSSDRCRSYSRMGLRMSAIAAERAVADAAGGVETRMWKWKEYDIRYKVAGEDTDGPPMVLVHGFGANADHWRRNMAALSKTGPVYAIDLLGYGFSSKPDPGPWKEKNAVYNFETWSEQVLDFAKEVVGDSVFLVCNSVGGVIGLQAGVDAPDQVSGVVILNISLRMLHETKQAPLGKPFVTALQYVLRETPVGPAFFESVATAKGVSNILKQCYGNPDEVTDELVDCILTPGREPGAVKVFLDFLSYSGGPLPEELFPKIKVPVIIGWGDKDPWEPIDLGRAYGDFDSVEEFVTLSGAGHCPMDEAPHLVDPMVVKFIEKHST